MAWYAAAVADDPTRPRHGRGESPPRLLVIGAHGVRAVELANARTFTIGRNEAADLVVDDPELSRIHARLRWDGTLAVFDLGSSNGTMVRGQALQAQSWVTIAPGETIDLGGTTLVLEQLGLPLPGDGAPLTMDAVLSISDKVAASDLSVLLLGETGVGKGVLARRLHERSARRAARLVELNCAALPESLLEGELFGYERGAFTGATNAKPGLLEIADRGTVFLDEVGELPPSVQAKLLRVIEERNVMRLGGRDTRTTDVRFVAATNRDLSIEVAQGRFRSDLYYRLNGITLYIPPLRERRDEIIPLAESFLADAAARTGAPSDSELTPEVRALLLRHPWPGNVRELRNVVRRAVVLADGKPIALEHLFVSSAPPRTSAPLPPVESMTHARASAPIDVPVRAPPSAEHDDDPERRRILAMLEQCAGNQTRAAAALGMSRTTLSARLDAYGVSRPRKRTS